MRKKQLLALLLAAVIITLAACKAEPKRMDYLKAAGPVNTASEVSKLYDPFGFRTHYYYADGTVRSTWFYADWQGTRILEEEGSVEISSMGQVYGFDDAEKQMYMTVFPEESYEDYAQRWERFGFVYSPEETVIEERTENGDIYLTTRRPGQEETLTAMGYDTAAVQEVRFQYEFSGLLIAKKITGTFVTKAGETVTFLEAQLVEAPEPYQIDQQLESAIFSEDVRKVSVTWDTPDGGKTIITQPVGKGCTVRVHLPEAFDGNLYTDPQCTVLFAGDSDMTQDLQLYIKLK